MPFWLYQGLTRLALPFVWLAFRLRGEAPTRLSERLGAVGSPRRGLWFHAASVGEIKALAPLIEHFRDDVGLITLQSRQGLATAEALFGGRVPVRAAPFDHPGVMNRFLDSFQPTGLILYENELWPGWMKSLEARGVGAVLLNAELGERSQGFWRANASLLSGLSLATASDGSVALPCAVLPAQPLKLAGDAPLVDDSLVQEWAEWVGASELLIFANAHPEEAEAILVNLVEHANAKAIVAPRHPDKLKHFKRQLGEETDRLRYWTGFGNLGSLYALGGTVVLGGSFSKKTGAHSPMEALRLGRPVIVGPHAGKQRSLLAVLEQNGLITRWPDKPKGGTVDVSVLDALAAEALSQAIRAIERTVQSKEP